MNLDRRSLWVALTVCLAAACGGNSDDDGAGGKGGESQSGEGGNGGDAGKGGGSAGAGGNAGGSAGGAGGKAAGGSGGKGGNSAGAGGNIGGSGGSAGNSTFGDAMYLAVDGSGKTALSPDGKAWTTYETKDPVPHPSHVLQACYGQGIVIALVHATSPEGKVTPGGAWATTTGKSYEHIFPKPAEPMNAEDQGSMPGHSCTFHNGLFTTGTRHSTDQGKNWMETTTSGNVNDDGVASGEGVVVAVGNKGISWSADGKVWTKATVEGTPLELKHVAFGGTKFVAVPYENDKPTSLAFESVDGKIWKPTKTRVPGDGQIFYLSAAVKKVFVVGSAGTYSLNDSDEPGKGDWVRVGDYKDSIVGGDDTMAVTSSRWSTDGVTWKPAAPAASFGSTVSIIKLK